MKSIESENVQNPPLQPLAGSLLRAAFRGMRLACHLLYGLALALPFPLLGAAMRRSLLQYWSRALLGILHIRLEISGHLPQPCQPGTLLVANHISWLDVFLINAAYPSSFVAKSEVRSWPLIGLLCKLTRTVFIERSLRRDTLRANWAISRTLASGECVALFPEGTSTDGSQVRPFHPSLLQCAIDAGTGVQPVAIRYLNDAGVRSDVACYIGDMSLAQSLLNILASPSLHARLDFLPQIGSHGKTRRILADAAFSAITNGLPAHAGYEPCIQPVAKANTIQHLCDPAARSAYSLLLDPLIGKLKHPHHL